MSKSVLSKNSHDYFKDNILLDHPKHLTDHICYITNRTLKIESRSIFTTPKRGLKNKNKFKTHHCKTNKYNLFPAQSLIRTLNGHLTQYNL